VGVQGESGFGHGRPSAVCAATRLAHGPVLWWPDVTDLATPRHDGPVPSLRVFGLPAWLSSSQDEIMLGGPRCSPDEWLWGVYGGYTPRLRHWALGLVNGNAPMAPLAASDFLGSGNDCCILGPFVTRGSPQSSAAALIAS
jgi:hypothetical protein